MKAPILATVAVCLTLVVAGCGGDDSSAGSNAAESPSGTVGTEPSVELPKGAPPKKLVVKDLREGDGEEAKNGDELTTQFVAAYVTGERFESSWEPGNRPFTFRLGADESSPGWERGLPGMRVGGRRELIIPPKLTSRFGVPPGTGPEQTLVYVIDLLEINGAG